PQKSPTVLPLPQAPQKSPAVLPLPQAPGGTAGLFCGPFFCFRKTYRHIVDFPDFFRKLRYDIKKFLFWREMGL
ncbi:MAG: hypothetical protein ACLRO4_05690, partial [Lachnospiraceae bacterium]